MEGFAKITVSELGIKCRSKKEVYNLLWNEGAVYLPPIKDANHKFISQIMVGEKKYLKWSSVKVCTIPHYGKLRISDLIKFTRTQIDIDSYLPDYEYTKLQNRQWLCNVLNTLIGPALKKYIDDNIKERAKYVVNQKKLSVKALPELIHIFKNSNNVSVENGRTNHLIKKFGKRKWDEIENTDRDKLKDANKNIELLKSEIDRLEEKIIKYEDTQNALLKDKDKLYKLYEAGYIDSDGEIKQN